MLSVRSCKLFLIALCSLFLSLGILFGLPAISAKAEEFSAPTTLEELRLSDPADIASLSRYDSRDFGIVTPARNQYSLNICWCYAVLGAAETSILREGLAGADVNKMRFYERNLAWETFNPRSDEFGLAANDVSKTGAWDAGGYVSGAGKALLRWLGPVAEGNYWPDDIKADHPNKYLLEDMIHVDVASADSESNIKRTVARYGAVAISYYMGNYFRWDSHYLNNSGYGGGAHASVIVGWDDSIGKENFGNTPSRDGAWIVKNSWGEDANDGGFFYLSYDSYLWDIWAFDFTTVDTYDHQYLYNGSLSMGFTRLSAQRAAAIYRSGAATDETQEKLTAVNIGVGGEDVTAKISVYKLDKADFDDPRSAVNIPDTGVPLSTTSVKLGGEGFFTVPLSEPVLLNTDEVFSVVAELSNPTGDATFLSMLEESDNDMTFLYKDGAWRNTRAQEKNFYAQNAYTVNIRAYTEDTERTEPLPQRDLQFADVSVAAGEYRYSGEAITPEVTVTLGGKTLTAGSDYTLNYENNVFPSERATVTVVGKEPYTGEKEVYFTILKGVAPPDFPVSGEWDPIALNSEVKLLSDIALPDGWAWEKGDTPLVAGEMHVTARYIGPDAEHYETLTCELVLTITEPEPEPEPDPEPQPEPEPEPQPQPDPQPDPDPESNPEPDVQTEEETNYGCLGTIGAEGSFVLLCPLFLLVLLFLRPRRRS